MRRILEFLKSVTSSRDLMDTEMYVQVLGDRIAETGVAKAKAKCTIIREEDGNKLVVNVTQINTIDCMHFNVGLGGQCCVCGATYCKDCVSEKVGFTCAGCGRYVCPSCARRSIVQPDVALCGQCGSFRLLPAMVRRYLCE